MNIQERMTGTELATDIDMIKAIDRLKFLQERLQEDMNAELRNALTPNMNQDIVRMNLARANALFKDIEDLRDTEVLIANLQYAARTAIGRRSEDELRRLTGA